MTVKVYRMASKRWCFFGSETDPLSWNRSYSVEFEMIARLVVDSDSDITGRTTVVKVGRSYFSATEKIEMRKKTTKLNATSEPSPMQTYRRHICVPRLSG